MEELNLKEMFDYFIKDLWIIMITVILAVIAGIVYIVFIQKPMYNSYTTIVLTGVGETNETITQNDITLNSKLVSTYREIVKSRKILNQVIKNLDLDISYSELVNLVNVTNSAETELIKISANYKDPELARRIVDQTANIFSEEIVDIYNLSNVFIIDKGVVSQNAYNVNYVKQFIIYVMVGIILGSAIVFIKFYFDTSVKSIEDIEKYGITVLGSIPYSRKGDI